MNYPIDYIYTDLQFSEIIEDEWGDLDGRDIHDGRAQ